MSLLKKMKKELLKMNEPTREEKICLYLENLENYFKYENVSEEHIINLFENIKG